MGKKFVIKDKLLDDYITLKTKTPFAWGTCDCVLFMADWCEVLTGINPAEGSHGKYDSELSAYKHLKKLCNGDPTIIGDKYFKRIDENYVQKGDVALCDLNGKDTFGICGTRGMVLFKTPDGIMATKLVDKKVCWRIE